MFDKKLTAICFWAALMLGACDRSEPDMPVVDEPPAETSNPPTEVPAPTGTAIDVAAVLASSARSEEDRARDAGRKPAEVLAFLGVEPGMAVIDLMAAGGWYSEVLSYAVGDAGTVTAQNPPWLLEFRDGAMGKQLVERIGDRLNNVTKLDSTWAELAILERQYDAAISALNFHDAYYLESPEAAAELMASVYTILKPGGVFGVIDHAGNSGGDNKSLHRIDKALAVEMATAAGFTVEGDSALLENPADDHTQGVLSEGLRGQTDRFLLKLRKPAM